MTNFINTLYKYKLEVGLLGTVIGLASFRSVLVKIWKTKKTFNFPYEALILTLIGWVITSIYGILNKSHSTIILGIVYFSIFLFILYVKITNPQEDDK